MLSTHWTFDSCTNWTKVRKHCTSKLYCPLRTLSCAYSNFLCRNSFLRDKSSLRTKWNWTKNFLFCISFSSLKFLHSLMFMTLLVVGRRIKKRETKFKKLNVHGNKFANLKNVKNSLETKLAFRSQKI